MAGEYNMEVGSFLRFGVDGAKKHWLKLLGVIFLSVVGLVAVSVVGSLISPPLGGVLALVALVLLSFGFFKNVIRLSAGETFLWGAFLPKPMALLNFFAAMLILSLAVTVGLVLLIVPGIILALMFYLVPYFIVDKEMGIMDAFRESARLTQGHKMDIFLGLLVTGIIVQVLCMTIIAIPFAIPMSFFANAYPYVHLAGRMKVVDVSATAAKAESAPASQA